MKLLLDEQISWQVAERLRERGHDVVAATAESTLRGMSDPDLFAAAQTQGRAVVTYNRIDFEPLILEYAQSGREHNGLVIVHPKRFPSHEFTQLDRALTKLIETFPSTKNFTTWLQGP